MKTPGIQTTPPEPKIKKKLANFSKLELITLIKHLQANGQAQGRRYDDVKALLKLKS